MAKQQTPGVISWTEKEANEIDSLIDEMDAETPDTMAPDFSWDTQDKDEGGEPDPNKDEGEPKKEESEPDKGEGTEKKEETKEEDEVFYDPSKLAGKDEKPPHLNAFKSKEQALYGVVNKARFITELSAKLEKFNIDPNVLDLPASFKGDVGTAKNFLDLEVVAEMSDEDIRKLIYDSDKLINTVKSAINEEESLFNAQSTITKLDNEVAALKNDTLDILEDLDLDLDNYKNGEDLLTDLGKMLKDVTDKEDRAALRSKIATVKTYLDKFVELSIAKDEHTKGTKGKASIYTPEQIDSAMKQFKRFNSDHEVFKHQDVFNAFMGFIQLNAESYELGKSSEWKKALGDWDTRRQAIVKKITTEQAKKVVADAASRKPNATSAPRSSSQGKRSVMDEIDELSNSLTTEMDAEYKAKRLKR